MCVRVYIYLYNELIEESTYTRYDTYLSLRTLASRVLHKAPYQTVRQVLKDQSYSKCYPVKILCSAKEKSNLLDFMGYEV